MQITELSHQLENAQHQIEIRDELITERGLVLVGADGSEATATTSTMVNGKPMVNGAGGGGGSSTPSSSSNSVANGGTNHTPSSSSYTILSKANAEALKSIDGNDIGEL